MKKSDQMAGLSNKIMISYYTGFLQSFRRLALSGMPLAIAIFCLRVKAIHSQIAIYTAPIALKFEITDIPVAHSQNNEKEIT